VEAKNCTTLLPTSPIQCRLTLTGLNYVASAITDAAQVFGGTEREAAGGTNHQLRSQFRKWTRLRALGYVKCGTVTATTIPDEER
jgi:hypothetical protein